jgi:peptidyl-prolyl cis-trans isomerase D
MLRSIQKASANWIGRTVLGVVLGLIAISFGIWGIGDIFRGYGQSTLAKIGSTEIRVESFRQLYQDRLQQFGRQLNRPILPDQARALGLDQQLLNQVIAETVLDERAKALRLGIADAEIARQITENPAFKGLNGQFDRARFQAVLRNAGYTELRFLDEQRRTAVRQQLVGTVSGESFVSKTALDALNRFQNEERTVEYFELSKDQAGEIADPSPETLAKYFEERKVMFRAPEYRKVTIVALTPDDIASRMEISDADLKKAYQDRKAQFETPERRRLKQMVFPNLEEANAAVAKINSGTTFEALAAERGLKDNDIDLGTVAKTAVVDRDVAEAAFALAPGATSAPVQGRFGITVVKADTVEPGKTRSFEEVAEDLKRELALRRARNDLINLQEKIEDERLGGATLTDAAKKFGLTPRTIEAIDRGGRDPSGNAITDLPQNVDVLSAVFVADVQGEHEPLRLPSNGGYVWYDVHSITRSRERPLEEIKDRVLAQWRDEEIATRLRTKAGSLIEKLKAGTSFADAAASEKLKVEWRPGIKRGNPSAALSMAAVADIFRVSKNSFGSTEGAAPGTRIVFHVADSKVPPIEPDSTGALQLEDALRTAMAQDLIAQYITRLQNEVGVTINYNALRQVSGGTQN